MWDLFDFNSDGKTSLFEKVVGIELLESTSQDDEPPFEDNETDDDELDEDDSDEFDEDDDDFSNTSNRANTSNSANTSNRANSPNNQSVCLIEGESNSKSNSSLVSDTIDLAPSVSTVSTVCYTGDISSPSGKPTEQESKQEYSETEAREWLKTNPEAKRMYQQKRDRMMQTIKDKQHCFRVALKRTWEHYHLAE